jgi:hypothetical protein
MRKAYTILVGISQGKRPFGRWENNIKIDLEEMGLKVWTVFKWLRTCERGN